MAIGIYKLNFAGTSKVYIGQSKNIEKRYREHLANLKNGDQSSRRLQEAYDMYGQPKLEILCECSLEELNDLENEAIEIFDSYNDGFNSFRKEGGSQRGLSGTEHPNSKYSKIKILRVFSRLYKTLETYRTIAGLENVNIYLIHNIVSGLNHLWLQREYPEQFTEMLLNKDRRRLLNTKSIVNLKGTSIKLISPTNDIVEITNIRQFCINHPDFSNNPDAARSSLGKVIKGTKPSHKGWKLST